MTEFLPPWTWSDKHDVVFAAYHSALRAGLQVMKTREADIGGKYDYRYAVLDDVLDAINGALADHDVAVSQIPSGSADGVTWSLATTLIGPDGEWMAFAPLTRPQLKDERGFGSALSYGRRYALLAIFGLVPEDDDARAASEVQSNQVQFLGNRTAEELTMKVILSRFEGERKDEIAQRLRDHLRTPLAELPESRHVSALDFLLDTIADPGVNALAATEPVENELQP